MFGLTHYEQLVLMQLFNLGPSRADRIADKTDMKLPRVYEALDSLVIKNFVSVKGSRPKIFSVKNPQNSISGSLDHLKSDFETKMDQMQGAAANLLDILEPLYIRNHTDMLPEDLLSQFTNLEEAQEYTNTLIQGAEKEILIFTHVFNWFNAVEKDLQNAIDRGVQIKVLMQTDLPEGAEKLNRIEDIGVEVKTSPKLEIKSRGTIVDQSSLIFVIWASETESNSPKRIYRPHYSTNQGIVDVFTGYFYHLWNP